GHVLGIELAREHPRPEQAAVAALLVAPRRHREGTPCPDTRLVGRVQALETREDAEGAVEGTALGHGVDVRAGHHGGPVSAEAAEGVAGGIDASGEPGLLHPAEEPGASFLVGGTPARASDAPTVGVLAEARECLDVGLESGERDGDRHGAVQYSAARE